MGADGSRFGRFLYPAVPARTPRSARKAHRVTLPDMRMTLLEGDAARDLVGHVIVRTAGKIWAVPVVPAGWLDEPRPGEVGDAIEHRRIRGIPAYRVWRTTTPD